MTSLGNLSVAFLVATSGCYSWPRGFLFVPDHYETAFETSCGLEVMEPRPGEPPLSLSWTLSSVQSVETRTLRALATTDDRRFVDGCDRFYGWRVVVVPSPNWESAEHRSESNPNGVISGTTDCSRGMIWVGNSAPAEGALPHEMAHAIQRCEPADDGKHYLDPHYGWTTIYDALKAEGLRP